MSLLRILAIIFLLPILSVGLYLLSLIFVAIPCASISNLSAVCNESGIRDIVTEFGFYAVFYLLPTSLVATPIALLILKRMTPKSH